jgi:transposase
VRWWSTAPFPTSAAGQRRALTWIRNRTQDQACLVVVEGTGSYGAGLAEHFTQGGIVVAEAPTIPAARPRGKDDAMDSARIARAVLGLRLEAVLAAGRRHPDRDPGAGLRARPDGH